MSASFVLNNGDTLTLMDMVVGLSSKIACEELIIGYSARIFLLSSTEAQK
jgi:hypothetical protein